MAETFHSFWVKLRNCLRTDDITLQQISQENHTLFYGMLGYVALPKLFIWLYATYGCTKMPNSVSCWISAAASGSMLLLCLVYFFVWYALGKKGFQNPAKEFSVIESFSAWLALWSVLVTFWRLLQAGDAGSFLLAMAGIAFFPYLRTKTFNYIYLSANGLLFVGTVLLYGEEPQILFVLIQTLLLSMVFYGVSIVRFHSKAHKLRQADVLARTCEMLRRSGETDYLSGLHNRAYLSTFMEELWNVCLRAQKPLGVLLLDLDDFRCINDTYGHQIGDEVLRVIGKILSGIQNNTITAFRYGGEEFLILFENAAQADMQRVADEIRTQLVKNPVSGSNIHITLSGGAYMDVPNAKTCYNTYLQCADEKLHTAKRTGKNRIILS
ncbi:MAG: GGDEF domain-containing protein [Oscillospiraceae bacterium]|nr:GGDEF domain-containing protein [Oscillospiraceae bacterium]